MKKKTWVIGGSVGAVVLLVLAMFPAIVSAHTTMSIGDIIDSEIIGGEKVNEQNNIFYKLCDWWPNDYWLHVLWLFLLRLILWFSFNHPPSS